MTTSYYHHSRASTPSSETDLPFPEPLPRSAFLSPTFSPATFLATLSNRHQTISDLRSDLLARSNQVSNELSTLVNDEYASFLSLGASLKGGDEKVEEVKVGVLGFEKGAKNVRDVVRERRVEMERLVGEKQAIMAEIVRGREMLAVADRVEDLERALELGEGQLDDIEGEDGDFEHLIATVHLFASTKAEIARLNGDGQFLMEKLSSRMQKVRKTLLLDLANALKQARSNADAQDRLLKIMKLYADLDETAEGVRLLKERR